jgi:hypothetical protein
MIGEWVNGGMDEWENLSKILLPKLQSLCENDPFVIPAKAGIHKNLQKAMDSSRVNRDGNDKRLDSWFSHKLFRIKTIINFNYFSSTIFFISYLALSTNN